MSCDMVISAGKLQLSALTSHCAGAEWLSYVAEPDKQKKTERPQNWLRIPAELIWMVRFSFFWWEVLHSGMLYIIVPQARV